MSTYKLVRKQIIQANIDEVWAFFSSPKNLDTLTPDKMGFEIITALPLPKMHEGQIIDYIVSPILGIPLKWRTEIINVEPKRKFVDLQIKGPYKLWKHTHYFTACDGGIEMVDEVEYSLPFGPIGQIAHFLFVKSKLESIFEYRFEKVKEAFKKDH